MEGRSGACPSNTFTLTGFVQDYYEPTELEAEENSAVIVRSKTTLKIVTAATMQLKMLLVVCMFMTRCLCRLSQEAEHDRPLHRHAVTCAA